MGFLYGLVDFGGFLGVGIFNFILDSRGGWLGLVFINIDGVNIFNSVVFVLICLCSDECIYFLDLGWVSGW